MYKPQSMILNNKNGLAKDFNKGFSLHKRQKTSRSLSNSVLTEKSISKKDNGIKLPTAYYNDRQKIYLNKSRALSQKSLSYQSKDISFSLRKKLNEDKIEKIIETRASTQNRMRGATMSVPNINQALAKTKFQKYNNKKIAQLTTRSKSIEREKKFLLKDIEAKRKETINKKWSSPFTSTNTFKAKFEGKNIVGKKIEGVIKNQNSFELKVLNLDRLFRRKDGKLGNIMPLPIAKIEGAASRSNLMKTIKKKDTIHQVIEQYNKLLRICKLKKTKPRIGVRGHNFTRSPTLEELMGIKIHQFKHKDHEGSEKEEISEEIFKQYNEFYRQHIKKDKHLATRLFAGLRQDGLLNLAALTRFYSIFINKIAQSPEKVKFLIYFFIPFGQQKIELGVLKLILELMCEDLPPIGNLASNPEFLTNEQKSKIFLEALNRVLFADLKQYTGQGEVKLNRTVLEMIFQGNEDAVDLLIKLLTKQ